MGKAAGCSRSRGRGGLGTMRSLWAGFVSGAGLDFDLDEAMLLSRCYAFGEQRAARGRDAARRPGGPGEESDFGAADGLEGGEAVFDERVEEGFDGEMAGDLASSGAADAVADDEGRAIGQCGAGVLVDLADAAGI